MAYELAIIFVRGLGLGAIYSLIALSFNVVYMSSGILNFAQGNILVLAGLLAALLSPPEVNVSLWFVLLLAVGCVLTLVVAAQGAMTLAPLRSSTEQHSWLVSTMAVSVIIGAGILIVQGPFAVTAPYPFPGVRILGVRTPFAYLAVMALLVLCFVALQLFLRRTRTGVAISALAQDLELAKATGLRVRLLQIVSFGISGAILGVTGFVAAPVLSIAPDTGISYILSGFIAAVIGGMGNLYGALVGGPVVGVMAMSAAYLFGGEFQNLVLLTLLVAVLMVRPQGLFGRMSTRHV